MKMNLFKTYAVTLLALFLIALGAGSAGAKPLFSLNHSVLQAPAVGATSKDGQARKPKREKKAKGKKGGGVTFHEGSAESRSERDRRLKRECKGRSNSGLCEGYTR